jgi:hypothetical protein
MNQTTQDFIARPFQSVLSDSLESLRQQYNHKLSPEVLRLINRRLIDLSDGLIFEFVVGNRRKDIVNQSIWEVIKWLPGANWIYHLALNYGIDLKCIIGDADTANQAQIQSTKHPVSPMDSSTETMLSKPVITALRTEKESLYEQDFVILIFFENQISINLQGHLTLPNQESQAQSIYLKPGKFSEKGMLVNAITNDKAGSYQGTLSIIDNQEYLQINHDKSLQTLNIPIAALTPEQHYYLTVQLGVSTIKKISLAA